MRQIAKFFLPIVSGFLLMFPLAGLFDAMNWPLFHSWGLAHGSFMIAWPMLSLIVYLLLRLLWRRTPPV